MHSKQVGHVFLCKEQGLVSSRLVNLKLSKFGVPEAFAVFWVLFSDFTQTKIVVVFPLNPRHRVASFDGLDGVNTEKKVGTVTWGKPIGLKHWKIL